MVRAFSWLLTPMRPAVEPRGPAMLKPDMSMEPRGRDAPWMSNMEMSVYAAEFGRTGFQAALNWYRQAAKRALS